MRVRVKRDVRRQLKKEIKLKKKEGDWFWPSLQYEKLPSFCYLCVYLDHIEKFCRLLLQSLGEPPQHQFRLELRASNHRNTLNISARWLREPDMEGGWQGSFGGDVFASNGDTNSNFKRDKEGNGNGGGDNSHAGDEQEDGVEIPDPKRKRIGPVQSSFPNGPTRELLIGQKTDQQCVSGFGPVDSNEQY